MTNSENKVLLEKLNRFTRRELSEDEVYIFPVTLCDNEIDRDNECFSRAALDILAEKFIGVTGILDHDFKSGNQTARLFDTKVVEKNRFTAAGELYAYLKGYAYMVRTDKNADLIREIDGGIKKEVSISCAAERQICSICGTDKRTNACCHIKGCTYNDKRCFITLDDICDVYEWSFVIPPIVHGKVCYKDIETPIKPMTNYEKIKAMDVNEMAELLAAIAEHCKTTSTECPYKCPMWNAEDCTVCGITQWLESKCE